MAALAVPRAVVARRGLSRRRPHARDRAATRREGNAHEDDAPRRHARDYLGYAGLYRESRIREIERQLATLGEEADFAAEGERLAGFAAEGRHTRPQLLALLGRPRLRIEERSPWLAWYGLTAYAALVHGPESSVWRGHTAGGTFVPARTWLGADGASGEPRAGHLARRYLAALGPASRADIAQWTGFARSVVDRGLAQLELRRFRDG